VDAARDTSSWQIWWWLNRAPYLNLKAALARRSVATGAAEWTDAGAQGTTSSRFEVRRLRARMVSVLSKALPQSHAPDLTTAVLLAIGKAGSCVSDAEIPALEETIRPLLQDANQEVAETAAIALGALAHPAPAVLLTEILEDSPAGRAAVGRSEVPYRTRAFAAYGLGLIGQRAQSQDVRRYIVRHLARALGTDRTGSDDLAVACVSALGLVHVEHATANASAPDLMHKSAISASLSGDSEAAYLLSLFAKERRSEVLRAYVPVNLVRSVSAGAPDFIDDSVAALCAVLEPHSHEPSLVQVSAAMALATLPATVETQRKQILSVLHECATHGPRFVGNLALLSIARFAVGNDSAAQARALFIRSTTNSPSTTRPWAALALGIHEHTRTALGAEPSGDARSAIRSALVDRRSPSELGACCIAAGLMHDSGARDVLVHVLLDGSDDELRAHAAIGLGLMEEESAIEPLRKVVADARYRPVLLRDAAIALGLLGDAKASSQLASMLAEAKSLEAQSAIASALGFIGDARAIEPLLALVESKNAGDRTKAFAVAALGNICDESLMPWNSAYALDVNYVLPPATLYEPVGGAGLLDLL
jgi:HEAT repeat protein